MISLFQASSEEIKIGRLSDVKADMILSQSIAVVLFHLDEQPQIGDVDSYKQKLTKSPWRFHHVTEFNTKPHKSHRVHTRQEFHELSKELPLFSIGSVHCGTNIVRVNIFTQQHKEMEEFYSQILDTAPQRVRDDFCLFRLQKSDGCEMQIALKSSSKIIPYPTDKVEIVIKVREIPQKLRTSQNNLCLRDPDQNQIVVCLQDTKLSTNTQQTTVTVEEVQERITTETAKSQMKECQKSILVKSNCESDPHKLMLMADFDFERKPQRPDVIPRDDHLIKPKQPAGPTLIKLGTRTRSNSPCPTSRKLTITTKGVDIKLNQSDREVNSVDVVTMF